MNDAIQVTQKRKRINLTLTESTHAKIRVWCAQRGVSMQSALEKMLDAAFDRVAVSPHAQERE